MDESWFIAVWKIIDTVWLNDYHNFWWPTVCNFCSSKRSAQRLFLMGLNDSKVVPLLVDPFWGPASRSFKQNVSCHQEQLEMKTRSLEDKLHLHLIIKGEDAKYFFVRAKWCKMHVCFLNCFRTPYCSNFWNPVQPTSQREATNRLALGRKVNDSREDGGLRHQEQTYYY